MECGRKSKFIRFMDSVHKVHSIEREPSKGIYVVRGETDTFKQLPEQIMCGLNYGHKLVKPITREKSKKGQSRSPKIDNARRLGRISFIDPEDGECKETIKNARRKLGVPMDAVMLCK